ncbi:MAG: tandem-95 repeat protein, partial [Phaeodactylibacter sp.]|nr:tandem-95 repeat protein [Phaeodactylibacter sp.]
ANIAAQRAFLNFSIWAAQGKAINVDVSGVAPTVEGGSDVLMLTANATGGTGVFTYQWVTDCPGTFSNPNGQTTIFTPSFVSEGVECSIRCIVQDDCGTRTAFDSESTTIVPAPVPPVANNDAEFTNPGVPVTLPPLANDTDLNLDIDPSSLAFWDPMTMMTIASPFTTPNGGTFTINFDGTVTYVSAPAFMGTEVIYYRICDLTDPMDGGPFCDVATITITVDETDEFGCTPLEEYRKLYTAYGVAEASNAYVSNPYFALGYPEGRARQKFAELKHNSNPAQRGVMTITLETTVLPGDVVSIYGWSKDGNPTTFSASSSDDGITFSDVQNYTVPDDDQTYTFDYTVTNPNGILFLRIANTNSNKEFRLDGISYEVKACQPDCVLPEVSLVLNGTADAFDGTSTAGNENKALGLPNFEAADINAGQFLILDLGDTIPNGSQVQLFLANDSQSPQPTLDVSGSLTNSSFTGSVNYIPETDKDESYTQFFYTVTQPTGLRYLRFSGNINKTYVDAVIYEIETCISGEPVAIDDVTYGVEGIPVTYEVQVNDYDLQNDPLTTTAITSPPSNGTAVINADGTITYIPTADFTGTDVLTYQICDPTNLCDEATLTIIIPNDNCSGDPGELPAAIGTGYGFTVSDPLNKVANEERAIGVPDGLFAELDKGASARLEITLSTTVLAGDVITYYISAEDATPVDYTVEIFNGSSWVGAQSLTVSGTTLTAFNYLVTDAAGAQRIRFFNNDADKKLRVDAVEYTMRQCIAGCAGALQLTQSSGFGTSIPGSPSSTAKDPTFAVGAPDQNGSEVGSGQFLIVDFGQILPQGTFFYFYLAEDGGTTITVKTSTTTTFGSGTSFSPTAPEPNYQQFKLEITAPAGARYVRFDGTNNKIFVDAVEYVRTSCENGAPIAVNDMTATPEETPVTYPVQINDSDPQGDPLSTTQILSGPSNGSAVINPDGTITYTPNNEFTGTDMLTYQICDPSGQCDDAVLTITVVNDGCASGESTVIIGTGYGFSVSDPLNKVKDEQNAIGVPDALFAELDKGASARLEITLSQTVVPGDKITYYVSSDDLLLAADFTVEIFNGSSWVGAESHSVSGLTFTTFTYTVADAAGAQRIRFINNDADEKLHVDAVEYNLRTCSPTGCVQSETAVVQSGYAIDNPTSPASTADTPSEALGAPDQLFSLVDNGDFPIVDFGQVLPQGTFLFFYFSSDGGTTITANTSTTTTFG